MSRGPDRETVLPRPLTCYLHAAHAELRHPDPDRRHDRARRQPHPADRAARRAVTVFPVLVIAAGLIGLLSPTTFSGYGPDVPYLLGVVMFCMGLTMSLEDFRAWPAGPGWCCSAWRHTM